MLEAGLPPAPTPLLALPPASPSLGLPTEGQQILLLPVLLVEAPWQIVITDLPSISAGGETTQAQGGFSSGQGTSRRRRDQQRASMFRRSKAASRQHQLLTTCVKLKELCKNGKLRTTPHSTIMEQLQNRADRFRKQGQLRDEELEATISGESQEYWLLAIRAAREESRLRATVNDEQQSRPRKRQQRA